MSPGAGVIYQYHQAHSCTTKYIKRIKTLVQSNQFWAKGNLKPLRL
jgi:hypothetical protein